MCIIDYLDIHYQHLPKGAVWTLRDGVWAPLIIHSAPLGRSRYDIYVYMYHITCPRAVFVYPLPPTPPQKKEVILSETCVNPLHDSYTYTSAKDHPPNKIKGKTRSISTICEKRACVLRTRTRFSISSADFPGFQRQEKHQLNTGWAVTRNMLVCEYQVFCHKKWLFLVKFVWDTLELVEGCRYHECC